MGTLTAIEVAERCCRCGFIRKGAKCVKGFETEAKPNLAKLPSCETIVECSVHPEGTPDRLKTPLGKSLSRKDP